MASLFEHWSQRSWFYSAMLGEHKLGTWWKMVTVSEDPTGFKVGEPNVTPIFLNIWPTRPVMATSGQKARLGTGKARRGLWLWSFHFLQLFPEGNGCTPSTRSEWIVSSRITACHTSPSLIRRHGVSAGGQGRKRSLQQRGECGCLAFTTTSRPMSLLSLRSCEF